VTDRDWKEIETQLREFVPRVPQEKKFSMPTASIGRLVQADEEALLAHIQEALAREK
jgi:hypothetical protein